jgi:hypothetical protein
MPAFILLFLDQNEQDMEKARTSPTLTKMDKEPKVHAAFMNFANFIKWIIIGVLIVGFYYVLQIILDVYRYSGRWVLDNIE